MKRALASMAIVCGLGFGQQDTPQFEAADVHASDAGPNSQSGGVLPGGRVEFRATTLLRLISWAYTVQPDRIAGGPSWLDTDRFDVVAKAPSAASQAGIRSMMQTLLAERFHMTIRREDKPQPVYALVLSKRPQPKESSAEESQWKAGSEENTRTLTCRKLTIGALAELLPQVAAGYFNRPVVDRTGLKAAYDFKLQWVPRAQTTLTSEGSLFTSIEKQLGVKVEPDTAPMPVLTIERVDRTPGENPPGTTEKLGAPPTEFEVASLRPSRPDEKEDFNVSNGRIDAHGIGLKDLIVFAYDVEDDSLRGGEKWLESDRYDIVAKTAPTASPDTLRTMLRSLLAERFKLKAHKEPQPITVYALTAAKPKLKDADPATRSSCKITPGDGGRTFTCQNTTMAQFAEKIRQPAGAYLDHPVVDLTGLKGSYDFTLTWLPYGRLNSARGATAEPAGGGGVVPTATDRPAGYTLFEAVDHHLGLKLITQKHPMPVVVIDHIERTPTEN
jgi:uncharacterized protein (TIGR03435 family)